MRIIIPAAGIGKRLRPHTFTTPKSLLPVAGRPVLAHILDLVRPLQPEEILFVVGHLGPEIERWVESNCPIPWQCVNQSDLLGLGYAVWLALEARPPGPVLILLGDTLIDTDLETFISAGENVLGVKRVERPGRFGVVSLSDNLVTGIVEKPKQPGSDLAAVGLYYLKDPSALKKHLADILAEDARTNDEIQLTDGLARLMKEGIAFVPFEVDGWYDCGRVETMLTTNARLLSRLGSQAIPSSCQIESPVWIDESAMITESSLGPNVSVQANCLIKRSTLENCIVGEGTKVTDSTVKDSFIAKNSVIMGDQLVSR